ncbi:unnamed protein product, partial [Darwinula stevensoni]
MAAAFEKKLLTHTWPGNIREIQHAIERAVILTSGNIIREDAFEGQNRTSSSSSVTLNSYQIEEMEKQLVIKMMKKYNGNNAKGESFEDLNASLNAVIKSFNQVRAEREATLHFIQAIIQQINVGILSYNTDGKIELINQAANKIMGIYKLSHVSAINIQQPDIYQLMTTLPSGESKLLKVSNQEISLSVKEIILRDRKIRLIALHNIRSELQNRELEAWQNLTKVLRHEIMNTVTPIVSLSQTMRDIIDTDLKDVSGHQQVEGVKDLKNAINTVINRSKGIMNFVNAYREFTNIPLPNVSELHIS